MNIKLKLVLSAIIALSSGSLALGSSEDPSGIFDNSGVAKKPRTQEEGGFRKKGDTSLATSQYTLETTLVQALVKGNSDSDFLELIKSGKVKDIEKLIEKDPSLVNTEYRTLLPLTVAVFYGDLKVVRLLLSQGADVNACTHGETPIMTAAYMGNEDMVRLLMEYTPDLTKIYPYAQLTACGIAAIRGHESIAQLLLNVGIGRTASSGPKRKARK